MRTRLFFSFAVLGIVTLLLSVPQAESQKGGGRPPGGGGGGFPPGGGGGGGKGMMGGDPNRLFDSLARGRNFFLISDTKTLREPLTRWAEANRITSGQITREQFTVFMAEQQAKGTFGGGGGGAFPKGPGAGGPEMKMIPGGGGGGGSAAERNEALLAWAEREFKRLDQNDDDYLNSDEAPGNLRSDYSKWDKNRDNLISMNEFKEFWQASWQRGGDRDRGATAIENIIDLEDLDKRPVVLRAGKTSDKLPKWFLEMDYDKDGQISLYEWRRFGKDIEEFPTFDLNGDALMTQEEALRTAGRFTGDVLASASPGDKMGGGKGDKGGGGFGFGGGFGKGGDKGGGTSAGMAEWAERMKAFAEKGGGGGGGAFGKGGGGFTGGFGKGGGDKGGGGPKGKR